MRVYLAGKLHDDPWRDAFRFGAPQHEYLDPSRHNDLYVEDQYTLLDLEMVKMSDLVVARAAPGNVSLFGTSLEVGYAYGLGIPVVLIDELTPAEDWRTQYFGMHRSLAQVVVTSVSEAVRLLARLPGDNNVASVYDPVRFA